MRWEFGFSCAFCLVHEADFNAIGTEGLGITSIEHYQPTSTDPKLRNDPGNCFYACISCNTARSNKPVASQGRTLLNPCDHNWAKHFKAESDHIFANSKDQSALYTIDAYNINDDRKVQLRELRRKLIEECLELIIEGREAEEELKRRAETENDPASLRHAKTLNKLILRAEKDLCRYRAIPADAPRPCRCTGGRVLALPNWLGKQTITVELPCE